MLSDPRALLKDHGLQVTAQRMAVLRAVASSPHLTANSVADTVRDEIGTISKQAVYDTLSLLTEQGILRRIQPAGSSARYETRVRDNHHHLVCRSCEAVVDVDCTTGQPPCLDPVDDGGFQVDEAEVTFWGTCPACQAPA